MATFGGKSMSSMDAIEEKPKADAPQWIGGVIFNVFTFSAILTLLFSHFVPSDLGKTIAFWTGLSCGVGGLVIGLMPIQVGFAGNLWKWPKPVRAGLMAVLMFAFGYETVSAGVFALFTSGFGENGSMPATISYWAGDKYRRCHHPELAGNYFAGTICVNDYSLDQKLPSGTTISLHGRKTALGINVRDFSR
jgi:hypothetical protein